MQVPRGRERGWHVVLLDDGNNREEHPQRIPVSTRAAADASAAKLTRGDHAA